MRKENRGRLNIIMLLIVAVLMLALVIQIYLDGWNILMGFALAMCAAAFVICSIAVLSYQGTS
jgi:hypothetical protein